MDTKSIIKEVKKMLADEYVNATISFNNVVKPLTSFLDEDFIGFVKEGANPESLVMFIKTNLNGLIINNNPILITVNDFIHNNPLYVSEIQLNETEFMNVTEYITNYALKNMQDNGLLAYAGREITLAELYKKIMDNSYQPVTLNDKRELCENFTEYIDDTILDSIMDGMKITVREYISNIVPELMTSASTIEYSYKNEYGEEEIKAIPIESFIKEIVDHQSIYLQEQKEKEKIAREAENNKTNDKPDLVWEITDEMKVATSNHLTEDERNSLLMNYKKIENLTDEEFYSMELNNIKEAIDKTTNNHDLEAKEIIFKAIVQDITAKNLEQNLQVLIESINELIIIKRNNIIKVSNNAEEYTDVILGRINEMMSEMNSFTTLDEYSSLYGKAIALYEEVHKKDIRDLQLAASFQLLFNRINERRLNLDAIIPDQSPEVERVKIELNGMMSEIKQNILTIEHEPNNLGSITGTEIRLKLNIQNAREAVMRAYEEKLLTEDDKEYYMSQLRGYTFAIESESKIGYGLR